jgi:hypothetical protein
VLSGRGPCDELITRPEESYRLWRVIVCNLENLVNQEALTRVEPQSQNKYISYGKKHTSKKYITRLLNDPVSS